MLWRGEANATFKATCSKSRRMGKQHERGGGTATVAGCRRPGGRSYRGDHTDADGGIEVDEIWRQSGTRIAKGDAKPGA